MIVKVKWQMLVVWGGPGSHLKGLELQRVQHRQASEGCQTSGSGDQQALIHKAQGCQEARCCI